MKKIATKLLAVSMLLCVACIAPAMSANAAMASATRLTSVQHDGVDSNYQTPHIVVLGPGQSTVDTPTQTTGQSSTWPTWQQMMVPAAQAIIAFTALFLLYMVVRSIVAHYKKGHIRMHSHSLSHRHR